MKSLKLQTQFMCMSICIIFSLEGQQFSAVSNGDPVEVFHQEWFGRSYVDSSGPACPSQKAGRPVQRELF